MNDSRELMSFPFQNCPPYVLYLISCLGIFLSFVIPGAAIQTLHNDYHLIQPFFYTFLQFFTVMLTCLPALKRLLSSHKTLTVPIRFFLFQAIVLTFSMVLHHLAAARLSRSTELLFKSPKLITVIVGTFVFLKRRLTASEIIVACLFVAGFVGIAIGDFNDRGDYDNGGIVAVFLSLLLEAVAVNFEEYLLSECHVPVPELMAIVFSIGSGVAFGACLAFGEFGVVVQKVVSAPQVVPYLGLYSIMGAIGFHFVFLSVAVFGSVQTVLFTSLRKVLASAFSIAWKGEVPFGWWYRGSLGVIVVALTVNAWSKATGNGEEKETGKGKPAFEADPVEPLFVNLS
jgi:drug/metabolite transporter (DMT)-like permease